MITYDEIRKNEDIRTYIEKADESLIELGYTEHSYAHVTQAADKAGRILEAVGCDAHTVELGKIAGFMHDIGNVVNRTDHSQSGAIMAFRILDKLGMPAGDIATIVTAIGNHDEGTGIPVNSVSAALILADKTDVRRSRVRNSDYSRFDIHDRVNYSVEDSKLDIFADEKIVRLSLKIDTEISSIMDYFEIFLTRMLMCKRSAEKLGLNFKLVINGQEFL